MPGERRGALPLALLIIAVLAAGVVFAVVQQPEPPRAEPTPTPTDRPTQPTPKETKEPTDGPTQEPTDGPTQEPTDEPTDEPTVQPTEPPDDGVVEPPPPDGVPLAETGGPVVPWLLGGSLLIGLGAAGWRLSRPR